MFQFTLNTEEPVFIKQFKIPDAYWEKVEEAFHRVAQASGLTVTKK
jgi:ferritin